MDLLSQTIALARRPLDWIAGLFAWLLGYRDVPWRNRLNFRIDFQSQLLWAAMMALAQPKITQTVAAKLMHSSSDMVQAVLQSAAAAGSVSSFLWAGLATGRSTIRFIVWPSTLAGLLTMSVAFVPDSQPYLFAGIMVCVFLAFSGVVTVRSAVWHLNYYAAGVGNVVSRFQISGMLVGAALGGLAGWLITEGDGLRRLLPISPHAGYRCLFLLLGACGIVAGLLCQRARLIDEPPMATGAATRGGVSLLAGLRILRHDRPYRQFLGFMMVFGFGTMLSDTILVLLMDQRFKGSASAIEIILYLMMLPMVSQLVTMPFAGRLLDRTNPMRVRVWGAAAWSSSRALLFAAAMTGSLPLLLLAQALSGIGGGLGAVAWQLGHMHFARDDLVQHYMGLHVTATGLRGLVAPFVAVALWSGQTLPGWLGGWQVPRIGAAVFFIAMVMQVAGGLGFFWMDRKYRELTPLGPEVAI